MSRGGCFTVLVDEYDIDISKSRAWRICTAWTWADYPLPSAASATTAGGNAMRTNGRPTSSRPTPRLNGKVCSRRIDAEEFYRLLDGVVIDDGSTFNARLKERQDYYSYVGSTAPSTGRLLYERLRQKTQAEARV